MSNPGDDFPANARYGVMCIEGYPPAAISTDQRVRNRCAYSFRFYVVDTVMCSQEMAMFKAVGKELSEPKVQKARQQALHYASQLNQRDRTHDRVHAAI